MMSLSLLSLLAVGAPPSAVDPFQLGLTAGLQFGHGNATGEGAYMLMTTADLRLRQGPWVFGVGSDYGGTMFGWPQLFVTATAGHQFRPLDWLSLELGAEAGAHHLWRVGARLFRESSGENTATLPFLGARAGVDVRLGIGGGALLFGLVVRGRTDLGHATVRPTVSFLSGRLEEQVHTVGGQVAYGGLHVGFEL